MDTGNDIILHNENLDDVLRIINKLARKAAIADYIYRGETERYEQISSSFYRDFPVKPPAGFNVDDVQEYALAEARQFTFESDDLAILTELQHYGGKTNLIDFTADYLIALFFACDGRHSQDGRVIFLERSGDMEDHINGPRSPVNRVIAQKSVFVRPPSGYIEVDSDDIVIIPSNLKRHILDHLRKAHGISYETVYNDLHGFIRYSEIHQDAFKYFLTALTNLMNGDYQDAISSFTESLDLNPTSFAYSNRGSAYINIGEYDKAIADFNRAIAIDSNYAVDYNDRGAAKAYKGDYNGAIADYDHAIAIDSDSDYAAAYTNRGAAKLSIDDCDGAIADHDYAIALDPDYVAAYTNRGVAKDHKGDYDGAISDYDHAIAIDPNYAEAYNIRGVARAHKGDYDQAIDDYDRAIAIDPNYVTAYDNRGITKANKGDYDGAISDYDHAIAIDPYYAAAYNNRGVAKLNKGDYTAAIDDCSYAIEIEPDAAVAYSNRGEAWLHLSEWDNARADLTVAKDMYVDIVIAFRNDYASVADFEQRNGIVLPSDIAEMLGG